MGIREPVVLTVDLVGGLRGLVIALLCYVVSRRRYCHHYSNLSFAPYKDHFRGLFLQTASVVALNLCATIGEGILGNALASTTPG
jgi:hypothetical protein